MESQSDIDSGMATSSVSSLDNILMKHMVEVVPAMMNDSAAPVPVPFESVAAALVGVVAARIPNQLMKVARGRGET